MRSKRCFLKEILIYYRKCSEDILLVMPTNKFISKIMIENAMGKGYHRYRKISIWERDGPTIIGVYVC